MPIPELPSKCKRSFIFLLALLAFAAPTQAARLNFSPEKAETGEKLSLIIDHAEKIAGMKVVIDYDKNLLSFVKASKAKATSSFMHVVNDKKPGKLIIVMASAKGVSGDNLALVHLEFKKISQGEPKASKISVTQIQLMDENLKEIKADHPEYLFPD